MTLPLIERNHSSSVSDNIEKKMFSKMSTTNKVASSVLATFSLIAGTTMLVAGIKSLGTATITVAGIGIAASPIGACIVGGVIVAAALILVVRLMCSADKKVSDIEVYVKDRTQAEKSIYEDAKKQLSGLIEDCKKLQTKYFEAQSHYTTCNAASNVSTKKANFAKAEFESGTRTQDNTLPHIDEDKMNKALTKDAKSKLDSARNELKTMSDTVKTCKSLIIKAKNNYETAVRLAESEYDTRKPKINMSYSTEQSHLTNEAFLLGY